MLYVKFYVNNRVLDIKIGLVKPTLKDHNSTAFPFTISTAPEELNIYKNNENLRLLFEDTIVNNTAEWSALYTAYSFNNAEGHSVLESKVNTIALAVNNGGDVVVQDDTNYYVFANNDDSINNIVPGKRYHNSLNFYVSQYVWKNTPNLKEISKGNPLLYGMYLYSPKENTLYYRIIKDNLMIDPSKPQYLNSTEPYNIVGTEYTYFKDNSIMMGNYEVIKYKDAEQAKLAKDRIATAAYGGHDPVICLFKNGEAIESDIYEITPDLQHMFDSCIPDAEVQEVKEITE